jgi:hypothetical protein
LVTLGRQLERIRGALGRPLASSEGPLAQDPSVVVLVLLMGMSLLSIVPQPPRKASSPVRHMSDVQRLFGQRGNIEPMHFYRFDY